MRTYNPLSVQELGRNAARALMEYDIAALPPEPAFEGAGVYILHYSGDFETYADLGEIPIYVGKADIDLHKRLREHAASIEEASNLALADFGCRWLVLEPVWVNLTEQILIARYRPVWNDVLKGFGIHTPGGGRRGQARSRWDTVHPGRAFARKLPERKEAVDTLLALMVQHRKDTK